MLHAMGWDGMGWDVQCIGENSHRAVLLGIAGLMRCRKEHVRTHLGGIAAHGLNCSKAGKMGAQERVVEDGGGLCDIEIEESCVDGAAQCRRRADVPCK